MSGKRIAITGASGHLGSVMMSFVEGAGHTPIAIGRKFPSVKCDAIFHLAAPRNPKDDGEVQAFYAFNSKLVTYSMKTRAPIIAAGTWWQKAGREAEAMAYSRMKTHQQNVIADLTLTLYSVYGTTAREETRGFIPQLLDHISHKTVLQGASRERRDFVHTFDVCSAFLMALDNFDNLTESSYDVCTGIDVSPSHLVYAFTGEMIPDFHEHPSATVPSDRIAEWLPGWAPTVDIFQYIKAHTG